MRWLWLALSAAVTVGGCTGDLTGVVVVVRSDLVPGREFAAVRVTLAGAEAAGATVRFDDVVEDRADASERYLDGVTVAELDRLAPRSYRIEAQLVAADGRVVVAGPVVVTLEEGGMRHLVTIVLARRCAGAGASCVALQ